MTTKNTNKIETLEDILFSEQFNTLFDIDGEIKEIEAAGWTLNECLEFGNQMAKKIK